MILNKQQYQITKAQSANFERALAELSTATPSHLHPLLRKAQIDGLRSQLADLRQQLLETEIAYHGID